MRDWEYSLGDKSRFFLRLGLTADPDAGQGASQEEAASWGHFQLWVNGFNLCAHTEETEVVDSVHWYLLPFLEWLAVHWDPLFHEEKLPIRVSGVDASRALHATWLADDEEGPSGFSEAEERDIWWQRHCIQAARAGGLFPRLFLRRWRDDIEFSWNTEHLPGIPNEVDYGFLVPRGMARVPVTEVVQPLYEVARACLREIQRRVPDSEWMGNIDTRFAQIADENRHDVRLAWLAGLGRTMETAVDRWQQLRQKVLSISEGAAGTLFGVSETPLAVTSAPTAALLFGAVAPSISEADLDVLVHLLVDSVEEHEGEVTPLIDALAREEAITSENLGSQAWDLADELREELQQSEPPAVDVESAAAHLGVRITSAELSDTNIRGVSIAGPGLLPTIVINDTYPWQDQEPVRRFTIAHELCHLLFDRSRGSRVAVASGPWTAEDVERRANAFAAYLLMPYDFLKGMLSSKAVISEDDVVEIASRMKTSASATLEHLYNVGLLTYADRERIRQTIHPRPMRWRGRRMRHGKRSGSKPEA